MQLSHIDFETSGQFSSIFLDYIQQKESLKSFYHLFPTIQNFEKQIHLKKDFSIEKRKILIQSLQNQYQEIDVNIPKSVFLLEQENTFTITTGHQLCLATGPLYFIYKIITTINLCKTLKKQYPNYNFVPIYWLASEDHDFAEVNHFYLFGKRYEWHTEQKGAVGRFLLEGLNDILNQIPDFPKEWIENFYNQKFTLSQATRLLVNHLFKDSDLICIDADDKLLKNSFKNIIKEECLSQKSYSTTQITNENLSKYYKIQVNPREINFFYLQANIRERIIKNDNHFEVLNTDIKFSSTELVEEIEQNPQNFSPNVILRPVYQEFILPNLAYIGGPGELAYWLQLKSTFDVYNVPFPVLMPRNFGLYIPLSISKKMNKFNFDCKDWFLNETDLKKKFLLENENDTLNFEKEDELLEQIFIKYEQKTEILDKGSLNSTKAELHKINQSFANLKKKLQKMAEQKDEVSLKQIMNIKEKLFPNNVLQERNDNFLNFFLNNSNFLIDLQQNFNPFAYNIHIFTEES